MEAACFSETVASTYKIARRQNPNNTNIKHTMKGEF
jgi:hypothetical protein